MRIIVVFQDFSYKTLSDIMKKPNKIREARINKKRSRKNNIRKVKVRAKKTEEANAQPVDQQ